MWCPTTARCVSMDAYMINFPYGQCQSWVTATNVVSNQHACQLGNVLSQDFTVYGCEIKVVKLYSW